MHRPPPQPAATWSLAGSRDLSGDGTSDVVWYNAATGRVDLWKIANGQWAGSVDIGAHPLGWKPAGIGDLNGDGTNDVLWHNPSTGNVDLWKLVNGQWAGSVDIGSHPLGYQVAGIADFNLDGTERRALVQSGEWRDRDLEDRQTATGAPRIDLGPHPLGWQPVGIGDFDHDGTSDVAWYNPTTRNIDIWQIVNGHWSASFDVGSHPAGWAPAGIGDFNHDGTDDIAWYNSDDGQRRHLADRERPLERELRRWLTSARMGTGRNWRLQWRRLRRHRVVQFDDRQRRYLADRKRALGRERQPGLSSARLSAVA